MQEVTLTLIMKELQVIAKAFHVVNLVTTPCCQACKKAEVSVLTKIEESLDIVKNRSSLN